MSYASCGSQASRGATIPSLLWRPVLVGCWQEKATLQRDLAKAQASVADLQAANHKLEGICVDLEEKAQSHQMAVEGLQRELQVRPSAGH